MNILPSNFTLYRYGLHVRFVEESDAEFIVRLRTDEKLGRYINATKPDVGAQIEWTKKYKERQAAGTDYYFIFESPKGIPVGLCRIYDITEQEFTVGSWLFAPDAPKGAAILADIITRELAYELMPEKTLYFDVRKGNVNVLRYQATFGPTQISQDDQNIYFTQDRALFDQRKQLHLRMYAPKK